MELAGGVLRWPEDRFWASTPHYLYAALDGYAEAHGVKRDGAKDDRLRALLDVSPYKVKSIRSDPKAIVLGRR